MKLENGGLELYNVTIDKWTQEIADLANKEILSAAVKMTAIARMKCQPIAGDDAETAADIRAVAGSINYSHDPENYTAAVFAGNTKKDHFAAYTEFGTGEHAEKRVATLPKEWQDLAWKFFVNGKGTLREHSYMYDAYNQCGEELVNKLRGLRPTGNK